MGGNGLHAHCFSVTVSEAMNIVVVESLLLRKHQLPHSPLEHKVPDQFEGFQPL